MAAALADGVELGVGVGRRIGVGRLPQFVPGKHGFGERTGSGTVESAFAKDAERRPEGERLEGHYDFGARLAADAVDEAQIVAEQLFVEHVAGRRNF